MFADWLVEAYYLRLFLQLFKIPHYTTLQKFTDRINIMLLGKIISSFILFTGTRHIFAGINATGFKITYASEYYTNRAKLKRRKQYAKLSIGTGDVLKQIIKKMIFAWCIFDIVNNLSRWIILYELLLMGFRPFEAVIITSIAASSLSYLSINIISRRNKIFSSLKKEEHTKIK